MKTLLNLGIILAFSIGYMEWGNQQSAFVAQVEYQLLFKEKDLLAALTHPLILAGLVGQLIVLYVAFTRKPHKILHLIGILLLSAVMLLILLAGILSQNVKIILSVLPFIGLCIFYYWRRNGLPA
ncbi:MAG: hypothetical protein ACK4TA_01205 [Saprospiraceae bacterium]